MMASLYQSGSSVNGKALRAPRCLAGLTGSCGLSKAGRLVRSGLRSLCNGNFSVGRSISALLVVNMQAPDGIRACAWIQDDPLSAAVPCKALLIDQVIDQDRGRIGQSEAVQGQDNIGFLTLAGVEIDRH